MEVVKSQVLSDCYGQDVSVNVARIAGVVYR